VIATVRSVTFIDQLGVIMTTGNAAQYLVECEVRIWDTVAEPGCFQLVFSVCQSTAGKSSIEVGEANDMPSFVQSLITDALIVSAKGARELRSCHDTVEIMVGSGKTVRDLTPTDSSN